MIKRILSKSRILRVEQKLIILFIILVFTKKSSISQSCLPNVTIYTSQEEINNFSSNYPGCVEIAGDLIIRGSQITNLNGLGQLKKIAGSLRIIDCTNLNTLVGLNNLDLIGNLFFLSNTNISNFNGLSSLTKIENSFALSNNNNLVNFAGLENLKSVKSLSVFSNALLTSFLGLNNLQKIVDGITVNGNPNILSMSDLNSVNQIDFIDIWNNNKLENIGGFNQIESLSRIVFNGNQSLQSINGFRTLKTVNSSIFLANNHNLQNLKGFENIEIIKNFIILHTNNGIISCDGMDALKEVRRIWITNNQNLIRIGSFNSLMKSDSIWIDNNEKLEEINGFHNLQEVSKQLLIGRNNGLQQISGFNKLQHVGNNFGINFNNKLHTVSGFNQLREADYFSITNNPSLETISGFLSLENAHLFSFSHNISIKRIDAFRNLTNIDDRFFIDNCNSLESLSNFSSLKNINNGIYIGHNSSLESLVGLHNVNHKKLKFLTIRDNLQLSICNITSVCNFLETFPPDPADIFSISNNKSGCVSANEILSNCSGNHICKDFNPRITLNSSKICLSDTFEISVLNGDENWSYLWNNGETTGSLYNVFDSVTYISLIVKNIDNCEYFFDTILIANKYPSFESFVTNESCYKCEDGSISIEGLHENDQILWQDGSNTNLRTNLRPGHYSFNVTNSAGCQIETSIEILDYVCPILDYKVKILQPLCFGSEGQIEISPKDTLKRILYQWSSGEENSKIIKAEGTYNVLMISEDNCEYLDTFTLTSPSRVNLGANVINEICLGDCNGQLKLNAFGGVSPYKIHINNQVIIDSLPNLCAGQYSVAIFDSNECRVDTIFEIKAGKDVNFKINGAENFCLGDTIKLFIQDIFDSCIWNTNEMTHFIEVVSGGTYAVTITDGDCSNEMSVSLTQYPLLESNIEFNNNALSINIIGGTMPFDILWSTGENSQTIIPTVNGHYSVTIQDFNGCKSTASFNVILSNTNDEGYIKTIIYPNPATDILFFNGLDGIAYHILDLNGRSLKKGIIELEKVSIESLASGIYFIRLINDESKMIHRFIKY